MKWIATSSKARRSLRQRHDNMRPETCQFLQCLQRISSGKAWSPGIHQFVKIGKFGIPYILMSLQQILIKLSILSTLLMINWVVRLIVYLNEKIIGKREHGRNVHWASITGTYAMRTQNYSCCSYKWTRYGTFHLLSISSQSTFYGYCRPSRMDFVQNIFSMHPLPGKHSYVALFVTKLARSF